MSDVPISEAIPDETVLEMQGGIVSLLMVEAHALRTLPKGGTAALNYARASRVYSELERLYAETDRQQAETKRLTAELARVSERAQELSKPIFPNKKQKDAKSDFILDLACDTFTDKEAA